MINGANTHCHTMGTELSDLRNPAVTSWPSPRVEFFHSRPLKDSRRDAVKLFFIRSFRALRTAHVAEESQVARRNL